MRLYAYLYDCTTKSFCLIFRDEDDPINKWYVFQDNIDDEDNAIILTNALNRDQVRES